MIWLTLKYPTIAPSATRVARLASKSGRAERVSQASNSGALTGGVTQGRCSSALDFIAAMKASRSSATGARSATAGGGRAEEGGGWGEVEGGVVESGCATATILGRERNGRAHRADLTFPPPPAFHL